jgi:hypothetical protein
MTAPAIPTCPRCGEPMVLQMDPASPPDSQAQVLLADPPFRYACASSGCPSSRSGAS